MHHFWLFVYCTQVLDLHPSSSSTLKAGSTNPGSDKVVLMLELLQLVQCGHHMQQSYFIKAITYVTRDYCWCTAVKILYLKFRVSFIICTCGCVAYIYIYMQKHDYMVLCMGSEHWPLPWIWNRRPLWDTMWDGFQTQSLWRKGLLP